MTGFDYTKSALTADALLRKFGSSVIVRRLTSSSYNLTTGEATTGGADDHAYGAILPFPPDQIFRSGGTIQQNDKRALISAKREDGTALTEPRPSDQVVVGNSVYQVISVSVLSPAGTPVLYDMQVRR